MYRTGGEIFAFVLGNIWGVSVIISITLYYLYKIYNTGKLPKFYKGHPVPPGPEFRPFVGHLLSDITQPDLHKRLEKLGEKYGDIIQLQFGQRSAFIVRTYALVKELFENNKDTVIRTDYIDTRYAFGPNKDILISNGESWKINRGAFHRSMTTLHSANVIDKITQDEANKLVAKLSNGKPFIVSEEFINLTFNVLVRSMLGRLPTEDEKSVIVQLQTEFPRPSLSEIIPTIPYLDEIFPNRHEEVKVMVDKINEILYNWVDNPVGDQCMLYLLNKIDKVDTMSKRGMMMDMFVAGYDSVKFHMTWFLHLIVMYPKVQQRLQYLLKHDRDEYKLYFNKVYKEVFRYRPIMLSGIWYKNTEDIVLESNGYILPKDSFLFYDTWSIHHNKEFWKDPENFRPSRFSEDEITQEQFSKNYIGFFLGRRSCLGEKMSRKEIEITITTLLENYTFVSDVPLNDHTFVQTIMAQHPFYLRPTPLNIVNIPPTELEAETID